MKQLIVAAAIAMASVANAATCSWGVTSGSSAPGGGPIDDCAATLYGFVLTSGQFENFQNKGASGVSAAVWAAFGTQLASADYSVDYEMDDATFTESTTYVTSGGPVDSYMATIFAYKDESGNVTHYVGNVGEMHFTADVNQSVGEMNSIAFGFESGVRETANLSWSSVPEPTSGLLLLLGVAGLALRRRRA